LPLLLLLLLLLVLLQTWKFAFAPPQPWPRRITRASTRNLNAITIFQCLLAALFPTGLPVQSVGAYG